MNRLLAHGLAIVAALSLSAAPALAQQQVTNGFINATGTPVVVTPANPLPVTGSFSAGASPTGAASDQVQGAGASGATAVGNPVGVGGLFLTTRPTFTNGQRVDFQSDAGGNLGVTPCSSTGSCASVNSAADAAGTGAGLLVNTRPSIFNGTNWDRAYGFTAVATSGIGVQAVGPTCYFTSSLPTLTTGQYSQARCAANGAQYVAFATNPSVVLAAGTAAIGSLTAGTATLGSLISASWFTETTTAIGASATFTGTSRDAGAASTAIPFTTFGCRANVNQIGTLVIEDSVDNAAWFRAASGATTTDPLVAVDLQVNLRARYHRCNFINGATATTVQRIVSSYRD